MLAFVTTDGVTFGVVDGACCTTAAEVVGALLVLETELESELDSLPTLLSNPVSRTDHALGPPPIPLSVCGI